MNEPDRHPGTSANLGDAEATDAPSDTGSGSPTEALPEASSNGNGSERLPEASNGHSESGTLTTTGNGHSDTERLPEAFYATQSEVPTESLPSTRPEPLAGTTEKSPRRRFVPGLKTIIILLLLAIPLALVAGAAFATYNYSEKYDGKILPGATIANVDVGGMTRKQAMRAVKKALIPQMRRDITVKWRKQSWKVSPDQLGARSDAAAAVERALAASGDVGMFEKAQMRWLGKDLAFHEDVALRYPKKGAFAFIEGIASGFDENPLDAAIDYSSGWVKIVPETVGLTIDTKASGRNLLAALRSGQETAKLEVDITKPEVLADDFDQILLLRQSDYTVYMYEDGKITHEWPVAVGTSTYPTPTGQWTVIDKVMGPTWTNPAPDGWGSDMPATIPPGPSNPLGLAAVYWDASGIRFHGTSDTGSIGTAASHGCVRMYNEDVLELYDLVEIGTPIISVY